MAKNRDRILHSSIELFNEGGIVAMTTNHIAEHLDISPGNLYFHFRNKEEIIRVLFDEMCENTYDVWKQISVDDTRPPLSVIEQSFEVFWNYRFFHREMYHLRRKDPSLARKWRKHILKTYRLLKTTYGRWVKSGVMRDINDAEEMQMISDVVLITSSSFLQFFESREKPGSKRILKQGVRHIARLLLPYYTDSYQKDIRLYLST
jgi:AcrR family transcriptional regulator